MENKKVIVTNMVNRRVGMTLPDLHFKRTWEKKGAKKPIDLEILEQAIYDPGVEYMFRQGILAIDDMEVKKFLGLEPEDATEPENIIILTDAQRKRYLTVAPISELKEIMKSISYEQRLEMANYAIENNLDSVDRAEVIKSFTDIDVISAIRIKRQEKEGV